MSAAHCLGFVGVKGGVGVSLLTALAARLTARSRHQRIALVDLSPESSSLNAFLQLRGAQRPLGRLRDFDGALTPRILETFFSASPEGVLYLPAISPEGPLPAPVLHDLLSRLRPSMDQVFIDLSSLHEENIHILSGLCQRALLIASSDPLCLSLAAGLQTRVSRALDGLEHTRWCVQQLHPKHPLPKDLGVLPKHPFPPSWMPYGGDDLGLSLGEGAPVPPGIEKAVEKLMACFLEEASPWRPLGLTEPKTSPLSPSHHPGTPPDPARLERIQDLHQRLLKAFHDQGVVRRPEDLGVSHRSDLEPRAKAILEQILSQDPGLPSEGHDLLIRETLQLAFGLGPLEPFLSEPSVTEIMVNGPHRVYVERQGKLEAAPVRFLDDQQLRTSIERILSPIGRRLDESQPYVDGRLSNGSRVNAVLPPISLDGPILTIRKFSSKQLTAEDLVQLGSLTPDAAKFLGACVRSRKNIVVSGGTGSGKTTLLNVLSCFIPEEERIVTIEDSAELRLSQDHVVRLEARPANLEGKGRVAIRDLVINALRMRPDRIVVGEVRGGEALDMLQAMNTGHDGSLTTCHANTPRDALSRLETMCLMSGLDLPLRAVREQVVRAVHLVVQQSRLPNGKRAVTHIAEVRGLEGEVPVLQDLFQWDESAGQLARLPFKASFER